MRKERREGLVKNRLKEGFETPEVKRERERHKKHPDLYSCFYQRIKFAFANFNIDMLVEADNCEAISIDNVRYKITDTITNNVVTNEVEEES